MDSDQVFLNRFDKYFQKINNELNRPLSSNVSLLEDIGNFSLLGKGKRLRPLLFVLSARLCGYQGEDIYHYSTIFEYLHAASLLHDDVMDNADVRRKKPSANHVWGNSAAVLSGDFISSKAFSIAADSNNLIFLKLLIDTATRMAEGQMQELIHTNDLYVSEEMYMEIIVAKTAELTSTSCVGGAIIAGAEGATVNYLRQFGLNFGIAFQLMDDLLDYTSSEEELGKPTGKDLKEGKITLPLIYALSDFKKDKIEKLIDLFKSNRAREEDYIALVSLLRNSGAFERIKSKVKIFVDKAEGFLDKLPFSPAKQALVDLNLYNIKRNY